MSAISHTVFMILTPGIAYAISRQPPPPPVIRPVGAPRKPEHVWAEIRRLAQRDDLSNYKIAELTGVAFSTVAKYRRENGLARDARN